VIILSGLAAQREFSAVVPVFVGCGTRKFFHTGANGQVRW
jgi:hypothetical protein